MGDHGDVLGGLCSMTGPYFVIVLPPKVFVAGLETVGSCLLLRAFCLLTAGSGFSIWNARETLKLMRYV